MELEITSRNVDANTHVRTKKLSQSHFAFLFPAGKKEHPASKSVFDGRKGLHKGHILRNRCGPHSMRKSSAAVSRVADNLIALHWLRHASNELPAYSRLALGLRVWCAISSMAFGYSVSINLDRFRRRYSEPFNSRSEIRSHSGRIFVRPKPTTT